MHPSRLAACALSGSLGPPQPEATRPAGDYQGPPGVDPGHLQSQSTVGVTTNPGGIAEAGDSGGEIYGRDVSRPPATAGFSRLAGLLEDLPDCPLALANPLGEQLGSPHGDKVRTALGRNCLCNVRKIRYSDICF